MSALLHLENWKDSLPSQPSPLSFVTLSSGQCVHTAFGNGKAGAHNVHSVLGQTKITAST